MIKKKSFKKLKAKHCYNNNNRSSSAMDASWISGLKIKSRSRKLINKFLK